MPSDGKTVSARLEPGRQRAGGRQAGGRPAGDPEGAGDQRDAGGRGRRGRRRGRGALIALLLLGVLAAGAWVGVRYLLSAPSATPAAVEFEIEPGWGGSRVAAELQEHGLVRSARAFTTYLRLRDLDHSIGAGLYDLSPTMSVAELADRLVAGGRPRTVRIVIPEGWRAVEVVARLAENGIGTLEELQAIVDAPGADVAPEDLPAGAGLEGYLFPAAYDMPVTASAEEALAWMVDTLEETLYSPELLAGVPGAEAGLDALLGAIGIDVHGWVTLASIVQAEAASDEEMGIIAGVFVNRLDFGMPLQADPTVAYGLGKPMPELSAVAGDLRVDTPWNTYTRPGLPFGPIGNPGRTALRAVLDPVRYTEDGFAYLYFLHGVDAGAPVFRPNTNLPAHERDVDRFLRGN